MLTEKASQQKAANIAGFSLLFMAVLGPFAYFFVFQSLIVYGQCMGLALDPEEVQAWIGNDRNVKV